MKFNEKLYLDLYPDIKKALEDGVIESAYDHFSTYGRLEGRLSNIEEVIEDFRDKYNQAEIEKRQLEQIKQRLVQICD